MERTWMTIDGNEAAVRVAYKLSDVMAIYPITPSTPMGESADAWSATNEKNLWGTVPTVIEMQSEGGAAGALHGALQSGALATTFTASQGLLLMIPNMYKIAGELSPVVFHVAARSLATQGLSIFGDHSDVMATRATGFAMLASSSPQEAQDFALIAHAATLESRLPFLHFFDGFRTSHEINKIEILSDETLRAMIDDTLVREHRKRALSPDNPFIRGTSQNPDVYFQARESVNTFYDQCPNIVQRTMDRLSQMTSRHYRLFDYTGAPDADRVIIVMGSGAETVAETVSYLVARGEKVGVVNVHLYRPFSIQHFIDAIPPTARNIAVLDRTKEPGSAGEPLYLDVVNAYMESMNSGQLHGTTMPRIIGGRYGLSSKEFTPAMVKAIYDEMLQSSPKNHFTIGINDDVTHTSLLFDPAFSIEPSNTVRCVFWGLGSDGTVGANKNSIKIIGEETNNFAQGYFVYDSKKSGSITISHLRFGTHPIRAPYLIDRANFLACHQFSFLERFDVLKYAEDGSIFLLNSPFGPKEVWDNIPSEAQQAIRAKNLHFYVIDANAVAKATGMGGRVNTIMQTSFFAISGVLPRNEAIEAIKHSIQKTYGKRGEAVVQKNFAAVDQTIVNLFEVAIPPMTDKEMHNAFHRRDTVPANAPDFVRKTLAPMIAGDGDQLPVSALPVDGTYPAGTTQWEKRNITLEVPEWDPSICIQCGKCTFVCPHAVIREKVFEPDLLSSAPAAFKSVDAKFKEFPGQKYSLQVSPEDCTGCALCFEACPVKDKNQPDRRAVNMVEQPPVREQEMANWDFFLTLPEVDRTKISLNAIKETQLLQPLFEFSGACSGCGETPYIKLATQLFGDHMVVANATGCSSIFGGNLPTTPWTMNNEGRGPAWSNSLFEDNAEFGLGMRVAIDKKQEMAAELLQRLQGSLNQELVQGLLQADQSTEMGLLQQRGRVQRLREDLHVLATTSGAETAELARDLETIADGFEKRSVWIIGGDGWAYDIGYGGLDHVLSTGRNVNILILDTEVYSNTGGQSSKATPLGAVAKFAAKGKGSSKKDLGMQAMSYGNVYVARIAMGANDAQTQKVFVEAEAYDGPSVIIAYSHCIAHGIDIRKGLEQQKLAVQSGYWPLYRYNPDLIAQGKNPLVLESKDPSIPFEQYAYNETRYSMLLKSNEERATELMHKAQEDITHRWEEYRQLSQIPFPPHSESQE